MNPCPFDARSALQYARQMAFPRLVGTEGEARALSYLRQRLVEAGWEVREEGFRLGMTGSAFTAWALGGAALLCVAAWALAPLVPWASAALSASLGFFGLKAGSLWRSFARRWILEREPRGPGSKNLVAQIGGRGKRETPRLILIAHYDSKRMSQSLTGRILLFLTLSATFFALSAFYVLSALGLFHPRGLWASLLTGVALLLALFLGAARMNNRSPGGLDNASGAGVLLALAEGLASCPPRGLEVILALTGAEEMGLYGAYALLRLHGHKWDPKGTAILNLDTVGIPGKLRLFRGPGRRWGPLGGTLQDLLTEAALREGVSLRRFGLLGGLLMDHVPFADAGYPAASLCFVAPPVRHVHTSKDSPEFIREEGLREVGCVILRAISLTEEALAPPQEDVGRGEGGNPPLERSDRLSGQSGGPLAG
jgi:hypothetical protein